MIDSAVEKAGTIKEVELSLSSLPMLKALANGKHEYRITSASVSITVGSRLANDGEIAMICHPKKGGSWTPANHQAIKNGGGAYRHVSSQAWSVTLSSTGDWVNVANPAAYVFLAGYVLEKDTQVTLLVKGNVQFR